MTSFNTLCRSTLVSLICLSILLSSCSNVDKNQPSSTPSPVISATTQPTETLPPSPTPLPPTLWLSPALPVQFASSAQIPIEWLPAGSMETADVSIQPGDENPISHWVYALVAPFATVADDISSDDLVSLWQGQAISNSNVQHLYIAQNDLELLQSKLGPPSSSIEIVPDGSLLSKAWEPQKAWAIIPFEQLDPKWKVISIDEISPIQKSFDDSRYLLNIPISAVGENENARIILSRIQQTESNILPSTNRDPNQMTTVILTGVTALVRATAAMMEYRGMTYPGKDIREWLREADFTHINNEVPFAENCPTPRGEQETLVFCSKTEYIELLEDIGTDIVDLSGDHFADWGDEAILYTLDLYQQENWMVFGGGVNLEEGRKPLKIDHNGNKIAFLGCNGKDPGYAQASDSKPGAVHCDMEYLYQEIKSLKEEGYLPIVTMQHIEYYSYSPNPLVIPDFEGLAEAGAIIVSGNQAHQPQALEFHQDALIHYGLGNLFFDQYYEGLPMRQAFIDRHVFYGNRHISTELLTIMFIDYARPRPMTIEERQDVLTTVFKASGWNIPTEE